MCCVHLAGLLVLLAAGALLTWRQRRHRERRHQGLLPLAPGSSEGQHGAGAGLLTAHLDAYVQSGADQGMQGGGPRQDFSCHGCAAECSSLPLAACSSWQLCCGCVGMSPGVAVVSWCSCSEQFMAVACTSPSSSFQNTQSTLIVVVAPGCSAVTHCVLAASCRLHDAAFLV